MPVQKSFIRDAARPNLQGPGLLPREGKYLRPPWAYTLGADKMRSDMLTPLPAAHSFAPYFHIPGKAGEASRHSDSCVRLAAGIRLRRLSRPVWEYEAVSA